MFIQNIYILFHDYLDMKQRDIDLLKAEAALLGEKITVSTDKIIFTGYFPMVLKDAISVKTVEFNKLKIIPDSIGDLKHIESLAFNFCGSVPQSIGSLKNLRRLKIYYGGNLPENIDELQNLRMLHISYANVRNVNFIKKFTKLEILQIEKIPIISLPSLKNLRRLKRVRLAKLRCFSVNILEDICQLSTLESLDIYGSSIYEFTPDITKLKKLYYLTLSDTYIRELPDVFDQLPNLKVVEMYDTMFELPPSLKKRMGNGVRIYR